MSIQFKAALVFAIALAVPQEPRSASEILDELTRTVNKLVTELQEVLKPPPPPPTGKIVVPCGGSVQDAVTKAVGGDTVVLEAGCRYVEAITISAKASLVTVTSSATLPERRITPEDAELLPIVASGNMGPAVTGNFAANWKFDGVQFESTANGAGDVVVLQGADKITFDRVLLVAGPAGQKRGIRGNGTHIVLTRSHIANIWREGQDSQAFAAWDGAGPYTITDNFLEAASENVMFGGADSASEANIPSNILIQGNLFTKRLEWKPVPPSRTSGKVIKNLLELKCARRVTIRGNIFERNWTDAQNGYAILFKSVNQGGTAPWSITEDVTFENNIGRELENGFNILGVSSDPNEGRTTGRTSRITIRNNHFTTTGVAMQIGGGVGELTIERNTFVNGYTVMQLYGAQTHTLIVR